MINTCIILAPGTQVSDQGSLTLGSGKKKPNKPTPQNPPKNQDQKKPAQKRKTILAKRLQIMHKLK